MLTGWLRRRPRGIELKVIRHAGRRWEVLPGGEELVRSRADWSADALREEFGADLLRKKGDQRFVFRLKAAGREAVVKVEISSRFKPRIRSLYGRCKARKEWENHLIAFQRGLPTVPPLALGEFRNPLLMHEAVVITTWREGAPAVSAWRRQEPGRPQSDTALEIAARLGRIAAQTHKAGVYHNEMFVGNVLVDESSGEPELLLIDWKHARIKRRSTENDVQNLVRTNWGFNYGMRDVPPSDRERAVFLAAYLEATADRTDRAELAAGLRQACPDADWLNDLFGPDGPA